MSLRLTVKFLLQFNDSLFLLRKLFFQSSDLCCLTGFGGSHIAIFLAACFLSRSFYLFLIICVPAKRGERWHPSVTAAAAHNTTTWFTPPVAQ